MIDWTHVQAALTRAGFSCGKLDGRPGPLTWTALFAYAAGRQPDVVLKAIGAKAANWLTTDAIAQTPTRLAEFIAQTAHETGGYTAFEERLGYSADGLCATWPSRFTRATATLYAGKPLQIACKVYNGRMGNGDGPTCLDGWTYRGRGMLQLTGRNAYAVFGQALNLPLLDQPELAADPADSLVIAREFWWRAGVNAAVDRGDFAAARRATNGGTIGLADVAARRGRMMQVLA